MDYACYKTSFGWQVTQDGVGVRTFLRKKDALALIETFKKEDERMAILHEVWMIEDSS